MISGDRCPGRCSVLEQDPLAGRQRPVRLGQADLRPLAVERVRRQVEARRSSTVPGGGQVIDFIQAPGLRARLFVDGTPLRADQVTGNLTAGSQSESPNISFSYRSE